MSNKMTDLVNKIERRLGTKPLNLPDDYKKESWAKEVIENETLDTFSRYFPNRLRYNIETSKPRINGYFLIDEDICENVDILGVRDIAWDDFANDSGRLVNAQGYGVMD